ncbi:acyltransferase [Sphingomonas sp. CGMCC 1.13654]|uniref:Acyltransferase n=1 Tax=Sphingomonas chungangi TaxID=2683589 RepID=A0A838L453_9SPHN|nr:lipoyl domain-containing protein [Sphingomonas chungangi]MBA2933475.1 acyltransferase [Sphingomonas chungangi]MVW54808.1 acyltransferase [Sphingomonas chungangi]
MKITLKLARVGMSMQEATIAQWYKQPGESFVVGDPLYAIETDKVTQDVEATAPGVLVELLVAAGEDVEVGTPLCVVDVTI